MASISLAVAYLLLGIAICVMTPATTAFVSGHASDFEKTPYEHDALVNLAARTHEYVVVDHENYGDPSYVLAAYMLSAAKASMASPENTNKWTEDAQDVVASAQPESGSAYVFKLHDIDPSYSFTLEERNALDKANENLKGLLKGFLTMLIMSLIASMAVILLMAKMFRAKAVALSLVLGGIICLLALVAFGLWGLIDMSGFCFAIRTLLFEGAPLDIVPNSLLAHMFPAGYWTGMLCCCIAICGMLAVSSVVAGIAIIKRSRNKGPIEAA